MDRFYGGKRGAIVTAIVVAAIAVPVGALAASGFTDVEDGDTHAAGIAWLVENGLTNGCNDGTEFCGDEPVTRRQLATFLHSLATSGAVDAGSVNGATSADLVGPEGPEGPRGPRGPIGATGLTGDTGEQGEPGLAGAAGVDGVDGIDGVSGYEVVSLDRLFPGITTSQFADATISCPAGKQALGGGMAMLTDTLDGFGSPTGIISEGFNSGGDLLSSHPAGGGTGWTVGVHLQLSEGNILRGFRVFAICATVEVPA